MKTPINCTWLIIATIIAFTTATPAFAIPATVLVAPETAHRQSDGSYLLGALTLSPGQWRIQEAPSGPSSCCSGYRLVSDTNVPLASFTLSDPNLRLTSFQAVVQYGGTQSDLNGVWGWINTYLGGHLISSEIFGGHYWSQLYERQNIDARIPSSADRIEIFPRVNLGYTAFTYFVSSVPEPSGFALFACGLAILSWQYRRSKHS